MFRQGMKPRCLSRGQTLKIFIVKTLTSPLENVDITTSETLELTVRLRIPTGNRLDVSTTWKEKAKGWKWLAVMELTGYKNILDKNEQ